MAFTRSGTVAHSSLSGVTATQHHTATVASELNLADMAARAHGDLSDAPANAHHTPTPQATQAQIEGEENVDAYVPPDLVQNNPVVAKIIASVNTDGASYIFSRNLDAITDTATGDRTHTFTTDFSVDTYQVVGGSRQNSATFQLFSVLAVGSIRELVEQINGTDTDLPTSFVIFGDQ